MSKYVLHDNSLIKNIILADEPINIDGLICVEMIGIFENVFIGQEIKNGIPVKISTYEETITDEEKLNRRLHAYKTESDPLRFEVDFDAIKNGVSPDYTLWIAKVEEIKQRYPIS